MAIYCFVCPGCGVREETTAPDGVWCSVCDVPMSRDYRAENVGLGSGVRVSRQSDVDPGFFLPTTDDFKGPSDPDGTKGLREWREGHGPKEGGSHPEERLLRRSW